MFPRGNIPLQESAESSFDSHCEPGTTAEFERISGTWKLTLRKNVRIRSQEFPQGESRSKWIAKVGYALESRDAYLSLELTENPPTVIDGLVVLRFIYGTTVKTDVFEHMFRNNDPLVMRAKDVPDMYDNSVTFEFTLMAKYISDAKRITIPKMILINTCNILENLKSDIFRMFREKKLCDVTINVKDQVYSAHKLILVSRSPVFAAMFESNMQESLSNHITITDFEPEIVQSFLEFLYSGNIHVDSLEMAIGLLRISDKYEVLDLKSETASFLMMSVSDDNAVSILLNADLHGPANLKERALKHICQKPSILSDEHIITVSKKPELLCIIIRGISKELDKSRGSRAEKFPRNDKSDSAEFGHK